MRVPQHRMEITLRLWVPVLMLRIVAAQQEDNVICRKQVPEWGAAHPHAINISGAQRLVRSKEERGTIDTKDTTQWDMKALPIVHFQLNQVMGGARKLSGRNQLTLVILEESASMNPKNCMKGAMK